MQKRETYIDSIKIYACILVVLGHFFQSMIQSGIIADTQLCGWFDRTIYYFHVPLFFICSGYLYQKYSRADTYSTWKSHVAKKALALLIPYFAFSIITYLLKLIFSSAVNTQVDGLLKTLFLSPLSPYWYLYTLFLIFLITPTFANKTACIIALVLSLLLKVVTFIPIDINVFALYSVCEYSIWFVMGMCLCRFDFAKLMTGKAAVTSCVMMSCLFVVASILAQIYSINNAAVSFVLGISACIATVVLFKNIEHINAVQRFTNKLSKYTMPVFLMHTIFAATVRAVLIKLSITNSALHIILGLVISFVAPMIAAVIMSKVRLLDFLLYPTKYVKLNSRGKNNG